MMDGKIFKIGEIYFIGRMVMLYRTRLKAYWPVAYPAEFGLCWLASELQIELHFIG